MDLAGDAAALAFGGELGDAGGQAHVADAEGDLAGDGVEQADVVEDGGGALARAGDHPALDAVGGAERDDTAPGAVAHGLIEGRGQRGGDDGARTFGGERFVERTDIGRRVDIGAVHLHGVGPLDEQEHVVEARRLERGGDDVGEHARGTAATFEEGAGDAVEELAIAERLDGVLPRGLQLAEDGAEVVRHESDEEGGDHGTDEAVEVGVLPAAVDAGAEGDEAEDVRGHEGAAEDEHAAEGEEEGGDEECGEGEVVVGAAPAAAEVDGHHRQHEIGEAECEDVVVLRRLEPAAEGGEQGGANDGDVEGDERGLGHGPEQEPGLKAGVDVGLVGEEDDENSDEPGGPADDEGRREDGEADAAGQRREGGIGAAAPEAAGQRGDPRAEILDRRLDSRHEGMIGDHGKKEARGAKLEGEPGRVDV